MNISEFERMISLADEKYVDEMFEDRIYGKRKNIFISFAAAAAALTVTIGGISYFVSNAGNDDIAVTDQSVAMIDDLTDTEVTDITEVIVPVDYEEFFRNKSDEYPISFYCHYDNEFGNDSQNAFDIDYVKSIIPFSAESYSDSRSQAYAYCDGNNEPFGVGIFFESEFDETASPKFRSINIYMCTAGNLTHDFPLEETEPVNCFGTDIYGFDDTAHYYEGAYDRNLKAYFVIGNTEYAVETSNLSCEETVNIIRDIIQSGFSITDFDLTAGSDFDYEVNTISFEEANTIEPFAGYIPQVNNVFYPYNKGPYYDIVKINGEIYCQTLSFAYTDGTDSDDGKRVHFEYYTRSTGRGAKPFDNTINLSEISLEKLNDFAAEDEYKFTINCYGFMINVNANCTANELWAYIESIKGYTYNNTITLAEASASTPFAEFLPKTDKIGDLVIGNIYYEKEKFWIAPILTLDYSSQGRGGTFSYYGIVYHMDQQRVLENVIELGNITKSDIEKLPAQSSGKGNNKNFDFSIDCGGIWINVHGDCTAEEIMAFIKNICNGPPFDIGKSNFYFTQFGAIEDANKLEPFAGYVPTVKEIGDMKIYTGDGSEVMTANSEEYGRVLSIAYQSEVISGDTYGKYDFKAISVTYTEKKAYNIPESPVISIDQLPLANLDDFKTDGIRQGVRVCYRFIIDCGTCYISVGADCLPDEMQAYINSLVLNSEFGSMKAELERKRAEDAERKRRQDEEEERRQAEASAADSGNTKEIITISKLKELAKKGDSLTWSDFDGYDFTDVGSGIYIRSYGVEGGYTLTVGGGSLDEKPMYIYLDSKTKQIDIRYDSIDDIIG